jgi:hypothetical protein
MATIARIFIAMTLKTTNPFRQSAAFVDTHCSRRSPLPITFLITSIFVENFLKVIKARAFDKSTQKVA